jgi:glycosyltransferase involved in cell wall biosynthesis/peptidoglycan/xylan/chitin deacetylase (PgdA/CDA1 family)
MSLFVTMVTPEHSREGGGLARSSWILAALLEDIGFNVNVVTTSYEDMYADVSLGAAWQAVPGGYQPDLGRLLEQRVTEQRLEKHLRDRTPDICIAFSAGPSGSMTARVCARLGIPYVVSLRGSDISLAPFDPHRAADVRTCLALARQVVALSTEMLETAKSLVPSRRWEGLVLPNPVSGLEAPAILVKPRSPHLLGIGARRLNEKKGVGMGIRVLQQLVERYPEPSWALELAGTIDVDLEAGYRELAEGLGVLDRIEFLGDLEHAQYRFHIQQWGVALQLSPAEGFCNSMVDAMEAGVPIMLTPTGYLAEHLGAALPEMILPFGPPPAIADSIHHYISASILVHTHQEKARKQLLELTRPRVVARRWQGILDASRNSTVPLVGSPELVLAVIFHDVSTEPNYTSLDAPAEAFEHFLDQVHDSGWRLCSAAEYFAQESHVNQIICTFDDAYEGVYEHAFPLMRERGFTGTVYVPSAHIGHTNTWNPKDFKERRHLCLAQLSELVSCGWEVGGHGHTHVNLRRLPVDKLRRELSLNRSALREHFPAVTTFAYPYGAWSSTVANEVAQHFDYAFAVETGGNHVREDRYFLRRYHPEQILRIIGASPGQV